MVTLRGKLGSFHIFPIRGPKISERAGSLAAVLQRAPVPNSDVAPLNIDVWHRWYMLVPMLGRCQTPPEHRRSGVKHHGLVSNTTGLVSNTTFLVSNTAGMVPNTKDWCQTPRIGVKHHWSGVKHHWIGVKHHWIGVKHHFFGVKHRWNGVKHQGLVSNTTDWCQTPLDWCQTPLDWCQTPLGRCQNTARVVLGARGKPGVGNPARKTWLISYFPY